MQATHWSRVAEAILVVIRPAQPAAEEPEQLLARIGQRAAVGGAQFGVAGLQVHQIVEPVHQGLDPGLAANPFIGRLRGGVLGFIWHGERRLVAE
jgi:hypothetical protein